MAVYCIRAGLVGPVKLGLADDPLDRLAALQTANHELLALLRVWQGGAVEEALLHAKYRNLHIRGEWFAFSSCMLGDHGLVVLYPKVEEEAPQQTALTTRCVVQHFGGPTALSAILGVSVSAVTNWQRDGLPFKFWHRLVEMDCAHASPLGLTPSVLSLLRDKASA